MNFTLHDFQEKAAADILYAFKEAVERYRSRSKTSAISLSAVTGAGKTVIATAVLEALLEGEDFDIDADPDLTVLWLTDDPSLNEQTRRKILVASNRITPRQLVAIGDENPLDQRVLDPGTIYFLNIHKLGKGATRYMKTGDSRDYSLWDTIRNTIEERGASFLLVIDEAHRGTSNQGSGDRKTIASRLVSGDQEIGLPPAPIVFGISATPERFNEAISNTDRNLEPVTVDIEQVRESGLIKDLVRISFPTETQPSDLTFIEQAIDDILEFNQHWSEYANEQDQAEVRPVLVIQVPPSISRADLAPIVDTVKRKWDGLDDRAIGHSFQDHTRLDLGDDDVRYVAPQDIQDDPHIRVVLFKEALTTGWDCPRAEVMVSLRRATDHIYIAQLIGRMVRTPLARRISASEVLNSVALHLPFFDEASVSTVVEKLRTGDDQIASEVTTNAVVCKRNSKIPESVWEAAAKIPTYTRPAKVHRNEVARLNSFAQLLAATGIYKEAPKKAQEHIIKTLEREASRLGNQLDQMARELAVVDFKTKEVATLGGSQDRTTTGSRTVSTHNIEDLFKQARRLFGDAAAKWYWDYLCDEDEKAHGEADAHAAKLRVAALSQDRATVEALQTAAAQLFSTWRQNFSQEIGKQDKDDLDRFYTLFQQSRHPEQVDLILPNDITVAAPNAALRYEKHLYVNGNHKYPADLNKWEQAVLNSWLPLSVAWYRNPSSGRRAVAIPYKEGNEEKTMYPDFIFFREVEGEIVVDIVDPHDPSRGDTIRKWVGLAEYAEKHRHEVGQLVAVIQHNGDYWTLDLRDSTVKEDLNRASSEADVREIFSKYGGLLQV